MSQTILLEGEGSWFPLRLFREKKILTIFSQELPPAHPFRRWLESTWIRPAAARAFAGPSAYGLYRHWRSLRNLSPLHNTRSPLERSSLLSRFSWPRFLLSTNPPKRFFFHATYTITVDIFVNFFKIYL